MKKKGEESDGQYKIICRIKILFIFLPIEMTVNISANGTNDINVKKKRKILIRRNENFYLLNFSSLFNLREICVCKK